MSDIVCVPECLRRVRQIVRSTRNKPKIRAADALYVRMLAVDDIGSRESRTEADRQLPRESASGELETNNGFAFIGDFVSKSYGYIINNKADCLS